MVMKTLILNVVVYIIALMLNRNLTNVKLLGEIDDSRF
jgi:hypothetical protein